MKKLVAFAQVLLFLVFAQGVPGASIYVSDSGTGAGTIASPASLWDALATAKSNGESDVIFLRTGTYTHDPGFLYDVSGTDATNLTLSGGWNAAYTLQSGDAALTALDGQDARRVLKIAADGAGVDIVVTLRNLAVQNGMTNEYTPGGETGYGAGIYVMRLNGSRLQLILERCLVRDNEARHVTSVGGGLYVTGGFALRDTVITGNLANNGGGAIFAGFSDPYAPTLAPTIEDCWFEANRSGPNAGSHLFTYVSPVVRNTVFKGMPGGASSGGGALNVLNSAHPVFEGCRFEGNVGNWWGGAIHLWNAGAEIRNCLFVDNHAGATGDGAGGAITTYDPAYPSPRVVNVVNSTFVANFTRGYQGTGGAIHNRRQTLNVANSVFWGNGVLAGTTTYTGAYYALRNEDSGTATISYSDIQGSLNFTYFTPGPWNMDLDPLFAAGDPDYRLQEASPCVDAGDNAAVPPGLTTDFEDDPRIFAVGDLNDPVVDMGWDEFDNSTLEFTAPAPGTVWLNDGSARTITWVCQNIAGNVRLYLWQGGRDDGHEVLEIAAAVPCADQGFTWTPPANLYDDIDFAIAMDSLFYPAIGHGVGPLVIQHLTLLSPNGGQSLVQGAAAKVTWQSGNLGPAAAVRVELYSGTTRRRTLAAAAPNTGSFSWKVSYADLPGAAYRIRISTASPHDGEDASDAAFRILPAVTLTSPNGGQIWKRGVFWGITWNYKYAPGGSVRLDLYKGGVFNRMIVASTPLGAAGKGHFLWRIPSTQTPAATYTIRVRSTKYPNCLDFSNKAFTITK
jgi:hypothetical protein